MAISADGSWLGRDCGAGCEVVGDAVGGIVCFSAGVGETGCGASAKYSRSGSFDRFAKGRTAVENGTDTGDVEWACSETGDA